MMKPEWTSKLLDSLESLTRPRGGGAASSASQPATAALAAASTLGAGILLVQLFTDSDPVGRCARFFCQLRDQVSKRDYLGDLILAIGYLEPRLTCALG
jgi:hypothetical protein